MRSGATRNVGGLPTSCSSAPHASVREHCGLQLLQQQQRVNPHVAFGMKLRRLLHAVHAIDLRQHLLQQAGRVQQLESRASVALGQHLGQLVANPLAADLVDQRRQLSESPRTSAARSRTESAPQSAPPAACAACLPGSGAPDRRWRERCRPSDRRVRRQNPARGRRPADPSAGR